MRPTRKAHRALLVAAVALLGGVAYANFVTNNSTLPTTKRDITPLPPGADPTRYIAAADYNALMNALIDVRTSIINGTFLGLALQATHPSVPTNGSAYNVWSRTSDGHLIYTANGSDTDISAGAGGGSVTSVGMSVPAIMSVAGSPVTTSGTLAVTLANESANLVWCGPTSGGAAAPTFRSLVAADLPSTAVTPGSYTDTNLTVDAQGRITAASNGSATIGGSIASTQVAVGSGSNTIAGASTLTYGSSVLGITGNITEVAGSSITMNGGAGTSGAKDGAFSRVQGGAAFDDGSTLANGGGVRLTVASGVHGGASGVIGINGEVQDSSGLRFRATTGSDVAGNIGIALDTAVPWTNAAAKLIKLMNNGTTAFTILQDGIVALASTADACTAGGQMKWNGTNVQFCNDGATWVSIPTSGGGGTTQTIDVINATAATGKTLTAAVANSGSNIGTIINNSTTLSGSTELMSVQNNGTEKFGIKNDGSFTETTTAIATGTTAGMTLSNTTASAAGAAQHAPAFASTTSAWGTTGGASQSVQANIQARSVQSTTGLVDLSFFLQHGGGALTELMRLTENNPKFGFLTGRPTLYLPGGASAYIVADSILTLLGSSSSNNGLALDGTNITASLNLIPGSDAGQTSGTSSLRWKGDHSTFFEVKLGAQLTAGPTITPTTGLHHVTGATGITTIAVTNFSGDASFTMIADSSLITWSTGGNIAIAGTLAQNNAQEFVYDATGTTWYPIL